MQAFYGKKERVEQALLVLLDFLVSPGLSLEQVNQLIVFYAVIYTFTMITCMIFQSKIYELELELELDLAR